MTDPTYPPAARDMYAGDPLDDLPKRLEQARRWTDQSAFIDDLIHENCGLRRVLRRIAEIPPWRYNRSSALSDVRRYLDEPIDGGNSVEDADLSNRLEYMTERAQSLETDLAEAEAKLKRIEQELQPWRHSNSPLIVNIRAILRGARRPE